MASGMGQTLVHEIFQLFQGINKAAQTEYVFELASDTPTTAGVATLLTSGTAPGYAPVTIDATNAKWQLLEDRVMANKEVIFFPAATASWPGIQSGVLRRSATSAVPSGTANAVEFFGHFDAGRIIDNGERFKILPGGFKIRLAPQNYAITTALANRILGLLTGENISAPASIIIKFGRLDPTKNNGDIGELVGGGYTPVEVPCDTTNFEDPLDRMITNAIEWDHLKFWTTTVNVSEIKSCEICLPDGTAWLRFPFSQSKNMRAGDNLRAPAMSLTLRG